MSVIRTLASTENPLLSQARMSAAAAASMRRASLNHRVTRRRTRSVRAARSAWVIGRAGRNVGGLSRPASSAAGTKTPIQCGTLAAVVAVLWQDIRRIAVGTLTALLRGRPLATPESRAGLFVVVGTVPIVAIGLACKELIEGPLRSLEAIVFALVAASAAMAVAELVAGARAGRGDRGRAGLDALRPADCLIVGRAQALALVPGTSRSGITISAGMLGGLDRPTAARFSFLLSLPAIAAAAVLELAGAWREILGTPAARGALAWGTLTAAVVG